MKKVLSTIILIALMVPLVACDGNKEVVETPVVNTVTEDEGNDDNVEDVDLYLSVAASVQDAILELQEVYEAENKNVSIIPNFGASGALMQQIEEGVDADLFISAGKKQVDQLEEKGLLINESRIDFLKNDLVLIVNERNKDKVKSLDDLLTLEGTAIAMGEPESVPAGKYTLEALQSLGLYDSLEPHIVFTKDVRQALDYVDTENTLAGFCYASDAKMATNSVVAEVVPSDAHAPIVYPAAILKDTKNLEEIEKFFAFLQTAESKAVFEKYGFKLSE